MSKLTLEEFLESVKKHELTINLDCGVYRDITIQRPGYSDRHYNITTRPGFLIFTGDMGEYVFERTPDMFSFFRSDEYQINPCYWSEKVRAGKYEEYSPEKAREALNNEFENWEECLEDPDEELIAEEKSNLDEIDTDDYYEFVSAIRDWTPNENGVDLVDFWEYNLNDYTCRYIWACYAIVHAIKLYDAKIGEVDCSIPQAILDAEVRA